MGCNHSKREDVTTPGNVRSTQLADVASVNGDNLPHNLAARYTLGEVIGEGGYSVVKLGISNTALKQKVAVKIVTRKDLTKEDEESLRNEVSILNELKHPNIVRQLDFFEEPKFFYIVLEYLDGGELFDRIVKKVCYNEKEARDCVLLVLKAIKHCHDRNIIHRDLKPENLLLTSKEDDADMKLADFGFAIKVDGDSADAQLGTPGYIAPEILECKNYGKPVDMWSFGVILFILLGGYPPFHDDNQRVMFKKIMRGDYEFHKDYWQNVSVEARDLISKLLVVDPAKRLTADQAMHHVWLLKDGQELEKLSLDANLQQLRKHLATRKLKAGVRAVMTVNKMKNLLKERKAALTIDPDDEGSEKEHAILAPTGV